jgi:hypothetical protein
MRFSLRTFLLISHLDFFIMSRSGFYPDHDEVHLEDYYNSYATKQFSITDLKEDVFAAPVPKERTLMTRIAHSFHRAENQTAPTAPDRDVGFPQAGDTSKLHRKLKSRHIQMIAIGGAIGAGLFIGSGSALATGGPGAVILDFSLVGFILFCTINALGELATMYPVQGKLQQGESLIYRIFHYLFDEIY